MAIKQKQSCKHSITQRHSVRKAVKEGVTVHTTVTWMSWGLPPTPGLTFRATGRWLIQSVTACHPSNKNKKDIALATVPRPVVQKVMMDLRYGKNILFALTDGIVLECGLTEGEVVLWSTG